MKTASVMLQNLSVPCACRCRYCLLSWDGKPVGIDNARSEAYARRFHAWITEAQPEVSFHYSYGYAMDCPDLLRRLDFMNVLGSVSGHFLQMDGFAFRSRKENEHLMEELRLHGVQAVNFTLYGMAAYHDRFAGRNGDFEHLVTQTEAAKKAEIAVSAGIPLTQENCGQTDELLNVLEEHGISEIRLFIPHEEGRGRMLADKRCTEDDYRRLSDRAKAHLNRNVYRTESEWMNAGDLQREDRRQILISLTPDNIRAFEQAECGEVLRKIEALDDMYYAAVLDFQTLLHLYGDVQGTRLYGKRDLYQHYQKRYIEENKLKIYDVTDERYCGSRRY